MAYEPGGDETISVPSIEAERFPWEVARMTLVELWLQRAGLAFRRVIGLGTQPATRSWETMISPVELGSHDIAHEASESLTRTIINRIAEIHHLLQHANALDTEASVRLKAAVGDALVFLASLPGAIPAPHASAAEDGEVLLEWKMGVKQAVAGFEGDSRFGYALLRGKLFEPGEHEGVVGGDLPEDLARYLGYVPNP